MKQICKWGALLFLCLLLLTACGEPAAETAAQTAAPEVTLMMETLAPIPEPTLYTLRFVAAGDNMAYFGNVRDAAQNAKGTGKKYDFTPSYTDVKAFIADYDLRFINQETLMCGEGFDLSYYPRFNSPTELGDAVIDAGFNIVGLANNHMLDMGERGMLAALDYWDAQSGITHIGSYHDRAEFDEIQVIEKNGISIALLAFTYGTNGISLRAGAEAYVPYLDEDTVREKVLEAEKLADLTVVSVHWGNENTFTPTGEQRKYANLITECGGDVILGHHSHCLQPIEWIEAGENRALCIFSLGNFMSEMAQDYNILGGMLTFTVEKFGQDGKAKVVDPLFYPTVFDYSRSFYHNHIYMLTDYTDAQAKAHGIAYYGNHTTLDRLYGYVQKVIDSAFLPEAVANGGS